MTDHQHAPRGAMRKAIGTFIALGALCLQGITSGALAAEPVPSHCAPHEFTYLTARMASIERQAGGTSFIPNGKFLSLCTDTDTAPAQRIIYRYGAMGSVELEHVATPHSPFFRSERSTSPHTGNEITYFRRGKFTYYVLVATGQGNGVSLRVHESRKLVVNLFSGATRNIDFRSGTVDSVLYAKSPALAFSLPDHALE